MARPFLAVVAASVLATVSHAQDIVRVNHGAYSHTAPLVADSSSCATGTCGTCTDCVRITEIKKTQVPVYSCTVKEICIPNCGILGHLFGNSGDCKKIEVRQLVKKYRTEEECVSKCVTAEEAAKHYEAEAKKAAAKAKETAPAPSKLPTGAVRNDEAPTAPTPAASTSQSRVQRILPTSFFTARKN